VTTFNRRKLIGCAAISALSTRIRPTNAEIFGVDRPIRVIVPRAAGGSVDVVGRGWSDGIRRLGGQSYIENIGGGGGRIGATTVVRAPPDGYTLLIGTTSEIVLSPLAEKRSFDPTADLSPVAILSTSPLAICADPTLQLSDFQDLVTYARANPNGLNFGSAGVGTIGHVEGELIKQMTGISSLTHVPYRGGSAAISDVMGARLTFAIVSISASIVDLHRAGRIRVLALTSEKRSEIAPEFPSIVESSYPELAADYFIGLFAPSAVSGSILDKLEEQTHLAMRDPKLHDTLLDAGFTVPQMNRSDTRLYIQREIKRWNGVLSAAGLLK
jgi:tripartite-type tricarboxylate transporter receptor subunit TctC